MMNILIALNMILNAAAVEAGKTYNAAKYRNCMTNVMAAVNLHDVPVAMKAKSIYGDARFAWDYNGQYYTVYVDIINEKNAGHTYQKSTIPHTKVMVNLIEHATGIKYNWKDLAPYCYGAKEAPGYKAVYSNVR